MLFPLLTFGFVCCGLCVDDDAVRVYNNFAEIRTPFYGSQTFLESDWDSIDVSHLKLDHCSDGYALRFSVKTTNAEDQKVVVRTSTGVNMVEKLNATLVNALSSLVRDDQTGRYFYVAKNQIEYYTKPSEKIVLVSSEDASCLSPVLTYVQRTLKWWSQHFLSIGPDDLDRAQFTTWANVQNLGKSDINTTNLELITGSHSSSSRYSYRKHQFGPEGDVLELRSVGDSKWRTASELHGLHVYPGRPAHIASKETYRFPLIKCRILFKRIGEISQWLAGSGKITGVFRRTYVLNSTDHYIPEGLLIIEESDRIVGETNMANTASLTERKIILSSDEELRYTRIARVESRHLSSTAEFSAGNITNLNIDLEFQSLKKQFSVDVVYEENVYSDNIVANCTLLEPNIPNLVLVTKESSNFKVSTRLEPNSTRKIVLSVSLLGAYFK